MASKQTIHAEFPYSTPEEILQYNNMMNYGSFLNVITQIADEIPKIKDSLCAEIKEIKCGEPKGDLNAAIADKSIVVFTNMFNLILAKNNVTRKV